MNATDRGSSMGSATPRMPDPHSTPPPGVRPVMEALLAEHPARYDRHDQTHLADSLPPRLDHRTVAAITNRIIRKLADIPLAYQTLDTMPADGYERTGHTETRSPATPGSHREAARAAHHDLTARTASDQLHALEDTLNALRRTLTDHLPTRPAQQTGVCDYSGCKGPIYNRRSDAAYCSDRCKRAAQAQRQRLHGDAQ